MQRVIIRKRIDRRILALVLLAVIAVPVAGTLLIRELRFWHEGQQAARDLKRGDLRAAQTRVDRMAEQGGLRKATLALVCELELQLARKDGDVQKIQRVLSAAAWIEKKGWSKEPRLDYWRGWAFQTLGADHREAAWTFLSAWQKSGHDDLELNETLYQLALATRRFDDALAQLARLAAREPGNRWYDLRRAEVALAMGKSVEARRTLQDLVFRGPAPTGETDRRAVRMLLGTLRDLRLVEETEFVYTWLMERGGQDPEWSVRYGEWLLEQNQILRARNLLWVAVLSNQTNLALREALAKTL